MRFKFIAGLVLSLQCAVGAWAQEKTEMPSTLVWQDEFEGNSLDYSKWGVEQNAFGGGNNELQLYTDRKDNVRVENGHLIIEARRDAPNVMGATREYSSGRIRTKHRGDWKYGKIEVRAKLPKGDGMWPAIWMLPTDNKYGSWASSGEIDIMEMKGSIPNEVLGTLHYGGQWPKNKYSGDSYKLQKGDFSEDFHTFSVVWTEGRIDWYVDGEHYQSQTEWTSAGGEFPAPFDQRFHIVLNLAVGGHLVKAPDPKDTFPKQMLIDYVRVYQ
ncbi:MAG: glycoside hydrolase family 16 protein [Planctomycetota bacterium]